MCQNWSMELNDKALEPRISSQTIGAVSYFDTPLPAGGKSRDESRSREAALANRLLEEIDGASADVKVLCRDYHLKREELGRLTGFSLRALAEWAADKIPSQPAVRRLREVRRLLDALAEIVPPASIPAWLHKRNPAFENMTPLQVIELGEIDRLWAMIHEVGSGQLD